MRGTVTIKNLEFQGKHGASADERRSARRFQVDVELTWDMRRAVESDRLADTLNYHDVCAMLVEIGSSDPHRLLESLAGVMVRALRDRWPFAAVTLELRKLHPPCPGNPSYTAVRLSDG
jgi:dihydroneopterin aldolase